MLALHLMSKYHSLAHTIGICILVSQSAQVGGLQPQCGVDLVGGRGNYGVIPGYETDRGVRGSLAARAMFPASKFLLISTCRAFVKPSKLNLLQNVMLAELVTAELAEQIRTPSRCTQDFSCSDESLCQQSPVV